MGVKTLNYPARHHRRVLRHACVKSNAGVPRMNSKRSGRSATEWAESSRIGQIFWGSMKRPCGEPDRPAPPNPGSADVC